jgi:hypothetical protein
MEQANAALPRFIKEFNRRFHHEPTCRKDRAFASLPVDFDLDTLPAAKYNRKTDNRSCFSFQNYTLQVDSPKPPVKIRSCSCSAKKSVSHRITTKRITSGTGGGAYETAARRI